MTVHNRREITLRCLQSLQNCYISPTDNLQIFLTDDGSTDGTKEAIESVYRHVHIVEGDGQLYWCGGMRLAMKQAMSHPFDFYLWLNDDVNLFQDAIQAAIEAYRQADYPDTIIVGTTQDPVSKSFTHGGVVRHSWLRRMRFLPVIPTNSLQACDTIGGSFVLVPHCVALKVGQIDERFRHQLGDYDYGFRAGKLGCRLLVMPGYAGECVDQAQHESWKKELRFGSCWDAINSPKGFPVKDWCLFCYRHAGIAWLAFFLAPYIRHVFRMLFNLAAPSKRA